MIHQLEADGIQLSFSNRRILSDIYLKCETGKITGLLGRNGAGKSCLMKIIYGTMPCEKSVRINRKAYPQALQHPALLQYLPQFSFIPKHLSLQQIFKNYQISLAGFEEIFPEFARCATLAIGHLSGGGRRLVELYVILQSQAAFAMLDEPFSQLSPVQIDKVKALLQEVKQRKGFLITDHLYQHITGISDRLYVLANGKTHLVNKQEDIETLGYARL
jgi:ABC-type multidrug transport system ATPase subunit